MGLIEMQHFLKTMSCNHLGENLTDVGTHFINTDVPYNSIRMDSYQVTDGTLLLLHSSFTK